MVAIFLALLAKKSLASLVGRPKSNLSSSQIGKPQHGQPRDSKPHVAQVRILNLDGPSGTFRVSRSRNFGLLMLGPTGNTTLKCVLKFRECRCIYAIELGEVLQPQQPLKQVAVQ